MVLNGNEIGGGSVRIFNKELQSKMFDLLGFSKEEAEAQFGFLMNAFKLERHLTLVWLLVLIDWLPF